MIPHHRQGVELAEMVPTRTANSELRVVAAHIGADQEAEIQTLNLLLSQWGEDAGSHPTTHNHNHDAMLQMGMVDQATLNELQLLDGAAFDALWCRSMIGHHQGAVKMAQDEIAHGQSPDAIRLAKMIIDAQRREIAIMTSLISAPV
jgi:uncharacterized protein (DUF305 family)